MSSSIVNSEINGTLPNSSNGLKTSVRKVVQQFKVSKLGKENPVALGSENTRKYNCKVFFTSTCTIFPYELFIKLYHWDKVGLQPGDLTNCGNSYYANAILQSRSFTRPLTSYLLQGLHFKACLILKAKEGISPLSPMRILSHLQNIGSHLGNGRQEDAHEFLRCNSYKRAKKKLTVVEAPSILTITLKRFQAILQNTRSCTPLVTLISYACIFITYLQSSKFGKLNKPVPFPEFLNLAPYMSGPNEKSPIYKLYVVVVHLDVMNASFSGYYVCYVRNIKGKWFKIDDNKVCCVFPLSCPISYRTSLRI
ncbi:hypothetical protein GIB67_034870 [Kingdonia uniflora]|uniref:USP domain-containing protein n=1 Tax=Kingdonia uniflora TaxID=39325 RepID=A0A7J7MEI0_9MAGN|nr:hypothetical protein GIB67_034870 [Kingdonia uniflora]